MIELNELIAKKKIRLTDNKSAKNKLTLHTFRNFCLLPAGIGVKRFNLIYDLLYDEGKRFYSIFYVIYKMLTLNKEILKGDNYLIIHNFWSTGYHHWLCEVIVKLATTKLDYEKYTLLLPDIYPDFALQTLQYFKFKEIKLIKMQKQYLVAHALIIENPKSGFFFSNHIESIRDVYQVATTNCKRRIFISRKSDKLRKIENEELLYPLLKERGFEIIELQFLNFIEQVELFSSTLVCIAIHGAGLTNMVFMNKRTKIIELYRNIQDNDNMNSCYYRLALASCIDYNCYFFETGKLVENDIDRSDIIVTPADLKIILDKELAN